MENALFKPYGYVFYHEQDLDRCIDTGELTIAFGAFADSEMTQSNGMTKTHAGNFFKTKLEEKGLTVSWNGDSGQKLSLTNFVYENVYDGQDWSYSRCVQILNKK